MNIVKFSTDPINSHEVDKTVAYLGGDDLAKIQDGSFWKSDRIVLPSEAEVDFNKNNRIVTTAMVNGKQDPDLGNISLIGFDKNDKSVKRDRNGELYCEGADNLIYRIKNNVLYSESPVGHVEVLWMLPSVKLQTVQEMFHDHKDIKVLTTAFMPFRNKGPVKQ